MQLNTKLFVVFFHTLWELYASASAHAWNFFLVSPPPTSPVSLLLVSSATVFPDPLSSTLTQDRLNAPPPAPLVAWAHSSFIILTTLCAHWLLCLSSLIISSRRLELTAFFLTCPAPHTIPGSQEFSGDIYGTMCAVGASQAKAIDQKGNLLTAPSVTHSSPTRLATQILVVSGLCRGVPNSNLTVY